MISTLIDLLLILSLAYFVIFFGRRWREYFDSENYRLFLVSIVMTLAQVWSFISHKIIVFPKDFRTINSILLLIIACTCAFFFFFPLRKKKSWSELDSNELLTQYIMAAKDWGKRLEPCDEATLRTGERGYDLAWWIYLKLQKKDPASTLLRKLLKHKDNAVRVLAARHLLWTAKDESLWVLDQVALLKGEIGRLAKEWAQDYREGKLPSDSKFFVQKEVS